MAAAPTKDKLKEVGFFEDYLEGKDQARATFSPRYEQPSLRRFYQQLLSRGKSKMVALIAAMRKLLTILNTMLKKMNLGTQKSLDSKACPEPSRMGPQGLGMDKGRIDTSCAHAEQPTGRNSPIVNEPYRIVIKQLIVSGTLVDGLQLSQAETEFPPI